MCILGGDRQQAAIEFNDAADYVRGIVRAKSISTGTE